MKSNKIYLTGLDDSNHRHITLKSNVSTILGRNKTTKIVDSKVSREQVELVAKYDAGNEPYVDVKLLGKFAQINDEILENDRHYIMKSGDILFLLKDKYKFKLEIKEEICDDKEKSLKRKNISESSSSSANKKLKTDKNLTNESNDDIQMSSNNVDEDNGLNLSGEVGGDDDDEDDDDEKTQKLNEDRLSKLQNKFSSENSHNDEIKQNHIISDVSKNIVDNDVKESYWNEGTDRLLIFHSKGVTSKTKIAGFDLDDTIITTKSGKVYPVDNLDWKFLYQEIPQKLVELSENDFKIVFFSNQLGISRGKINSEDFKKKLEIIVGKLNVPVQAFIASSTGYYRKPCIGMWQKLIEENNGGLEVDMAKSFFVGDAAGRPKDWEPKKKKDFACSDRLFSINIGLKFMTPEEFFLKRSPAPFSLPDFHPQKLDLNASLFVEKEANVTLDTVEIIIMVGFPAAGKSHFVKTYLLSAGYHHVNRDTLGSWQKCVKSCRDALSRKQSVVIDNTNPDLETRDRYTKLAKELKVKCRCFVMTSTFDHSRHNERFREMTDKNHQHINEMIFNSYKSKYKEPELLEGFDEILHINFVPKFTDDWQRSLYTKYLLEK